MGSKGEEAMKMSLGRGKQELVLRDLKASLEDLDSSHDATVSGLSVLQARIERG